MAIIIPSSKTYDRQNPKVRDNVIERIEVGAVEVVPDNEYDTPVYSENILLKQNASTNETNSQKEKLDYDVVNDPISPSVINRYWAYAFLNSNAEYYGGTIKIQRSKNNKYISTVNYGTDKWKIESNLVLSKTTYPITGSVVVKNYDEITSRSISQSDGVSEIVYDFPSMPTTVKKEQSNAKAELVGVSNNTNLAVLYEENEDSFTISYKILKKLSETKYVGAALSQSSSDVTIAVNGEKTEYNAEKIEITVYGNTIGIDLTDKTVYIPETDTTSKNVFSVEGNELMQANKDPIIKSKTVNAKVKAEKYDLDGDGYYLASATFTVEGEITAVENKSLNPDGVIIQGNTVTIRALSDTMEGIVFVYGVIYYKVDNNTIEDRFTKTLTDYKNGKETATIRCSISDYYNYESEEKVIAIDNSTNKMSFQIGDQVIPMNYGADRQDRPMSFYKNGLPKVFEVIGAKKYYDGAVWQELSLLEVPNYKENFDKTLNSLNDEALENLSNYSLYELN